MSGLCSPTPEIGGDPEAPRSILAGMRTKCGAGQWEKQGFVPAATPQPHGDVQNRGRKPLRALQGGCSPQTLGAGHPDPDCCGWAPTSAGLQSLAVLTHTQFPAPSAGSRRCGTEPGTPPGAARGRAPSFSRRMQKSLEVHPGARGVQKKKQQWVQGWAVVLVGSVTGISPD